MNHIHLAKRNAQGMTLIELIIAITILGVMFTVLYSGFHLATASQASGLRKIEQTSTMRLLFNFLRRTIEQSQSIPDLSRRSFSPDGSSFDGDRESLRLVSPVPRLGSGFQMVSIYSKRGSHGKQLVMSYRPLTGLDITGQAIEEEVVLLDKLVSISFAYLDRQNDKATWIDEWHNQEVLPALVRVQIIDREIEPGQWPTLLITTHINRAVKSTTTRGPPTNYGQSGRRASHGL